MRQARLESMVRIAEQNRRQRERELRDSQSELQRLADQHRSMTQLVRQYRDEHVGGAVLDPRSLAHRHAFSERLAGVVSDIAHRVERQAQQCESDKARVAHAQARELAVESVHESHCRRVELEQRRRQQKELDDVAGVRHARRQRGTSTGEQ